MIVLGGTPTSVSHIYDQSDDLQILSESDWLWQLRREHLWQMWLLQTQWLV
uniref:Uncharacterized protein n=1 Tax=Anguilla anguilla TaxID=7936 RepID=A0A0E9TQ15_ANGAN